MSRCRPAGEAGLANMSRQHAAWLGKLPRERRRRMQGTGCVDQVGCAPMAPPSRERCKRALPSQ